MPLLKAYEESEKALNRSDKSREDPLLVQDNDIRWAALRSFFDEQPDDVVFERKEQEREYLSTIERFRENGSSIFSFRRNLIEMLCQTDVDGLPIKTLRLPYRCQYVHLEDSDFLPDFSEDYKIDGFYLHEDTLEYSLAGSLNHEYDPEEPKPLWFPGSTDEWLTYRQKWLEENQADRDRYKQFKDNIDDFDYGKDWYSLLLIDFTFARKNGDSRALSGQEILAEPVLKCVLCFATHNTTVGEAVEYGFREGLPTETFDQSVEHKNSYLNVINRPDFLNPVVRLVFNLLAYLNWKDRDVVYCYPNGKFQAKIEKSITEKQRIRATSKAESAGFKKIYFCGYQTPYHGQNRSDNSVSPRAHWRRGHWRNQRHGEELADTKLIWIKPTLVNQSKEQDTPLSGHIYMTE